MTAPPARHRLALADDSIIDLIAVEIAARGSRPVALTRAERHLAAAGILARGGTPNVIAQRLHVSGTTALKLAAQCDGAPARTAPGLGPALSLTLTCNGTATCIRTGSAAQERDQPQQKQRPPGTPGWIAGAAGGQR